MRRRTRLAAVLLACLLLATAAAPAFGAFVSEGEAGAARETLGLLRGDGEGLAPERTATRAEALVMLLRLLGAEETALREKSAGPFADAGWAADYVGYGWRTGLVRGVSDTRFGTDEPALARDYVTMTLRALGYRDGEGDFSWTDCLRFSDGLGLTRGEYGSADTLLREDLALISYTALTLPLADGSMTLAEKLFLDGVLSADALKQTRLAGAVNAGKRVLTAAELYERSASAVFFTESFDTAEDYAAGTYSGMASGFFIRPDGLALMSWHQLDDNSYARATTLDGRCFPIEAVLYFDPLRDAALVRVSRTDTEGNTLRFFPWVPLGDSDAVSTGETLYTVSNPLGLRGRISDGLLAAKTCVADDPDYPYLQHTAPISRGSSGGALFNRFGEAVGIVYGSFVEGQSLNLAVPVNSVDRSAQDTEGQPLEKVREAQDEKKRSAVIWTDSETELRLKEGETITLTVFCDWPGPPTIRCDVDNNPALVCTWGEFLTKRSVTLSLEGVSAGEATVTISFAETISEFELDLHVTVDPAEQAPEEVPEPED